VRRLLLLLLCVPSVLAAQREPGERRPEPFYSDTAGPPARRAYTIGVLGYTGGTWQPSGVELAALWRLGRESPLSAGATLALGSFVQDQAVLLGRSRGFFAALGLTVRDALLDLIAVGSERSPAEVRLEVAADLAWSADFSSPLPQGTWDVRAALLPGITFGSEDALGNSIGVFYGPSALIGRSTTTTHGEFVLRFRMPIH
jgi:hypothetical protein